MVVFTMLALSTISVHRDWHALEAYLARAAQVRLHQVTDGSLAVQRGLQRHLEVTLTPRLGLICVRSQIAIAQRTSSWDCLTALKSVQPKFLQIQGAGLVHSHGTIPTASKPNPGVATAAQMKTISHTRSGQCTESALNSRVIARSCGLRRHFHRRRQAVELQPVLLKHP